MQRVLGREKKKKSLLAGMGHKEVASENVDKSSKCWCQQSRKLNKAVSAVFAENLCASLHMLFELITKKKTKNKKKNILCMNNPTWFNNQNY